MLDVFVPNQRSGALDSSPPCRTASSFKLFPAVLSIPPALLSIHSGDKRGDPSSAWAQQTCLGSTTTRHPKLALAVCKGRIDPKILAIFSILRVECQAMQHLSKSAIILLLVLTAAVPCTERTILWPSPYHRFYKPKEKAKPTLAPQDAYSRRPWQGGTCSLATVCEDYDLGKQRPDYSCRSEG